MKLVFTFFLAGLLLPAQAQKVSSKDAGSKTPAKTESTFEALLGGMKFRSIGPAVTSGRIADMAVNPANKAQWYLAVASGGVWKTDNAGTTFYPVFEAQGSYSVGCITLDPSNPHTVWVGSGENNNQRSVGFGDGVYKSEDGGKTWSNTGLKNSEHIGMIAVNPRNSSIVYVAAYGPLWSSGGDRGIYKTTDGGKTWNRILYVSENTGFNEIHLDPRNPDVLYAAAHQRRRHEWTYLGGGPESALYKSTDGGSTWNKLENGLPKGDIGRISIAIPPGNPDKVYALIEADNDNKGLYASSDRGASFEKRSAYATAGNYYMEIMPDPYSDEVIYSMNTWAEVSRDGGRTFSALGEKHKHVDNHAIWIDPDKKGHYLLGCDGGLYETWDAASSWDYKANLPVTQFYRVTVDNALPFYNVYGGTQDNNTLGGPSRTISASGIHNYDWFVTVGGDGFKTVVDPVNTDVVYSQWQYGGLVRYSKKTGEALDIRPQEKKGQPAYRFNWDAPILISAHAHTTLYFAAQYVFRSKDMGSSWEVISPDLSRGLDRNKLPVMGKVWSMDAVAKNQSTSIYGNITALSESALNASLLYAGTDDGLIHVSADAGKTWTKTDKIAGVPQQALVQNIYASRHDENIAYAVINNHRNGDFRPYIVKTADKGKTWVCIQSDLPERGSVQCLAEDHKNRNLLFAGTDFNLFASADGGKSWKKFSAGLPVINIKEIAIQERENDLVLATFGRGFYILDDYSPLQHYNAMQSGIEKNPATVFPVKDGLVFVPSTPLGHKGKSFQGESFYTAENPPVGACLTYYLKDDYKSLKELRREKEKSGKDNHYPSADSIRAEDFEPETYVLALVSDEKGNPVRSYRMPAKKGLYRLVWNGRHEKSSPVSFYTPNPDNPYEGEDNGPLAVPGVYRFELKLVRGYSVSSLSEPVTFRIKSLHGTDHGDHPFNADLTEFRRIVSGTVQYTEELGNRMTYIKRGMDKINDAALISDIGKAEKLLQDIRLRLHGDHSLAAREFETLPGINGALEGIVSNLWSVSLPATGTYISRLAELKSDFTAVYADILRFKGMLEAIEKQLDLSKFPYTPGRLPEWKG